MAEVRMTLEEYHNLFKGLNTLIKKLYEMAKEGNDYKRQRDELINDMQNVKRKAEAFDEIKELINWFEENDRYEFEGQVGKIIKIIKDLERGSDE
nr:hypothetical protein [Staphylococcus hominis]